MAEILLVDHDVDQHREDRELDQRQPDGAEQVAEVEGQLEAVVAVRAGSATPATINSQEYRGLDQYQPADLAEHDRAGRRRNHVGDLVHPELPLPPDDVSGIQRDQHDEKDEELAVQDSTIV